jgi:predicted  nucleic acid-binding Zn-ribbon protein
MSDTPRTDEQINGKPCTRFEILAGDSLRNASVQSEFARELERELNTANNEIEEKRKDVVWLATEKAKLENRIERLEEAGDAAIHEAGHGREHDALEIWNKAKEDKL